MATSDLNSHRQASAILSGPWAERLGNGGSVLLLAATFWVARYWHSVGFGLYEDDFSIVPGAVNSSLAALIRFAGDYFIHLGGHGRPLSDILYSLLVWVGWRISGLWGGYLIGFLATLVNIALFYWLARRLGGPKFALVAGLAYCLYSADTTQAYLNHSLGLQPALTFFYLASHAWLSRKTWLVYIAAAGALLTYETVYPLLFALPFLTETWDRRLIRRLLINSGILMVLLVLDALARAATGEGRVAGLAVWDAILTPMSHMLIGPLVSLGTYAYRPLQAIQGISLESALAMLLAFPAFFLMLLRLRSDAGEETAAVLNAARNSGWSDWLTLLRQRRVPISIPGSLRRWLKIVAAGAILLVLAYPLTFTVRAYAISGRDTRVHFAAVVGASIVVGCVATALMAVGEAVGRKRLAALVPAVLFSLMLGYGFVIQKDYVLAWRYQRDFWTQVVQLLPDVGDGTAVLVDPVGLKDTRQIGANYWNMPRVLNQLYQFPESWDQLPRVYRLTPDWEAHILDGTGNFDLSGATTVAPPSTYRKVPASEVILLKAVAGTWSREGGAIAIDGRMIVIKNNASPGKPPFPHGNLYPILLETAGQ